MAKYKVEFIKDRKGQSFFKRSLTLESLTLLLILCDHVTVAKDHRSSGSIRFVFVRPGFNIYAMAIKVPLSVLAKLIPEKEWRGHKVLI